MKKICLMLITFLFLPNIAIANLPLTVHVPQMQDIYVDVAARQTSHSPAQTDRERQVAADSQFAEEGQQRPRHRRQLYNPNSHPGVSRGLVRMGPKLALNLSHAANVEIFNHGKNEGYNAGFEFGFETNIRMSRRWFFVTGVDFIHRTPVLNDDPYIKITEFAVALPILFRVAPVVIENFNYEVEHFVFLESGIRADFAGSDDILGNRGSTGLVLGYGFSLGRRIEISNRWFLFAFNFIDLPQQQFNHLIQNSTNITYLFGRR